MPARKTAAAAPTLPAAPMADVAELYGLPLGEFTPARNALAGRLKKAGDREAAAEVQALVKPTPAAWAVNQLLRRERAAFDALLAAGERARSALGRTLSGAGPEVVREALAEMRQRREQLLRRGAELLAGDGRAASAAQLERLAVDLEAMALSPAAQEAVERGWLDRDLDPPGFEVLAGLQLAALPPRLGPAPPRPEPQEKPPAPREKLRAAKAAPARGKERAPSPEEAADAETAEQKAARAREEREAARRRERLGRLEEKVAQRSGEAEEQEVAAGAAEHEADVAEREARQAERAATEARRRAELARQAATRARERAARSAERLAQAQDELAAAEASPGA
jgi:hypothetical protein